MADVVLGFDSRYTTTIPADTEYKFAGIKVSHGTYPNPFQEPLIQWQLAKNMGLVKLPFHFWRYGGDAEDGVSQAENFWNIYTQKFLPIGVAELPPVLDIEDVYSPKGLSAIRNIMAFLSRIEELWGREPLIYSARWWFDTYIKPYTTSLHAIYKYKLWEADPPPDTPIGYWSESDSVIKQVRLDFPKDGFSAEIDEDEAQGPWYRSAIGAPIDPVVHEVTVPRNADIIIIKRV